MKRLLVGVASSIVAAASCAALAGSGLAAARTVPLSGQAPNGGCGPVQSVNLTAPSKIVAHVSATAAENGPATTGSVYVQFLDSSGTVLTSGPSDYRASGPGTYGVRVCVPSNAENPSTIQYSGEIALLSLNAASVKAGTAIGHIGVRTSKGIVTFNVNVTRTQTSLRVSDPARNVHMGISSGLKAQLGSSRVTLTGKATTFVLTQNSAGQQRVVFHWRNYAASGTVVSGHLAFAAA